MKLRIQDNSIRLRLERSELRQLLSTGVVECRTAFGETAEFAYALHAQEQDVLLSANLSPLRIEIRVDKRRLEAWATSNEPGLESALTTPRGQLQLLLEKDFPCRHSDPESPQEKFTPATMRIDADL